MSTTTSVTYLSAGEGIGSVPSFLGMTSDGASFFFTASGRRLYQYDADWQLESTTRLPRQYRGICYDPNRHCFWCTDISCNRIYQLTTAYQEVDCLIPCISQKKVGVFSTLSFDAAKDAICISAPGCLLEIDCCGNILELQTPLDKKTCCLAVTVAGDDLLYACLQQGAQLVKSLNQPTVSYTISQQYAIRDCLYVAPEAEAPYLYLLAKKRGMYPYLIRLDLAVEPEPTCDAGACSSNLRREEACTNIIEAIALEEAALSQMIQAESEALKRALKSAATPKELLDLNKSVTQVITKITRCEQLLYEKLNALSALPAGAACPQEALDAAAPPDPAEGA